MSELLDSGMPFCRECWHEQRTMPTGGCDELIGPPPRELCSCTAPIHNDRAAWIEAGRDAMMEYLLAREEVT